MSDRRENGSGQHAHAPLTVKTTDEYRALVEDLDHAWAMFTDDERGKLETELKRRRAANPNWPYLTSDHADRLAARIYDNTRAVHSLEESLSGPEGMILRMRASTSAVDMMREELAKHSEILKENSIASDLLRVSIDRLCAALSAGVTT